MENFDWLLGFVFPYINFCIFLFLAIKFFKKPLREMATSRRKDFEASVREANRAREEAEKENRELRLRLEKLDSEVASIKANAKAEAEREAEEMVRAAEHLAKHLKEEARRVADTELKRARSVLQKEIIEAVTGNVQKKLETELDNSAHLDIVHKRMQRLNEVRLEG